MGKVDYSKGAAHNKGVARQVAEARQEAQDENMDKIRKNYSKGYRTTSGAKARGNATYTKVTTDEPDAASGKKSQMFIQNDREYAGRKRFADKKKRGEVAKGDSRRNPEQPVYRKNLLGRRVAVTKTAQFGAVTQGEGTKSKQIGDKIITKTRTVQDNTGIPFLFGKNAKKYGRRSKQVDRVGTSTKKGFAASGDTRGVVTNSRLGYTGTAEDVKTKVFARHKRVGKR
jgi:hypothetical protein